MSAIGIKVKERLLAYIKYKQMSNLAFEKACGLSNGYIRNFKGNLGNDKLSNILATFPELSESWLLYGEGEMLKFQTPQSSKGDNTIQVSGTNVDMRNINQSKNTGDAKRIKELEQRLAEALEDKRRLQEMVDRMQAQISKLLEKI